MAFPERVLVDTSALYALVSASDAFHAAAINTFANLIDERTELLTTSHVLVESTALVHSRLGLGAALERLVEVVRSEVPVLWVDEHTHWQAWELLKERGGGLSIVDCATILVARRLGATVFSFDRDFLREGLSVLPRPQSP